MNTSLEEFVKSLVKKYTYDEILFFLKQQGYEIDDPLFRHEVKLMVMRKMIS